MNRGPIYLHIDELVLDGFEPADRHRIADAVQRELHTLINERGVPLAWRASQDRIDAGTVSANPRVQPAIMGQQIARAVYGGGMP